MDSLGDVVEHMLRAQDSNRAVSFLNLLVEKLRNSGINVPLVLNSPYVNTIPPEKEPPYPGDRKIERSIKSLVRWNAMAMVVNANRIHGGIGGHISTYASAATLYEVGFNHFFRGGDGDHPADLVFFQGHASGSAHPSDG